MGRDRPRLGMTRSPEGDGPYPAYSGILGRVLINSHVDPRSALGGQRGLVLLNVSSSHFDPYRPKSFGRGVPRFRTAAECPGYREVLSFRIWSHANSEHA